MIAKISKKFNIEVVILLISTLLIAGEVYWYTLPILSAITTAIYIILLGKSIGERISEEKELQWVLGITSALCIISIIGVLCYYPYKITKEISLLSILLPLLFLYKKKKQPPAEEKTQKQSNIHIAVYLFFALEIVLFGMILLARNGELMQSPWLAFSPYFFILFAITTTLLAYLLTKKTSSISSLIATIMHFFVFYSIAAIVYKLGYGFDGFIHRATESWILQNGFITPKEPFYIGQYGLIVTLSRITGVAIKYIDIFLVPVLASLSIPVFSYALLPRVWKITKHTALSLSLVVPFIFFLSFNLTTPHNLALLFLILTVLSIVGYTHTVLPYSFVVLLAISTLIVHPLLGVPVVILAFGVGILEKTENRKKQTALLFIIMIAIAVVPLCMFVTQQWLGGYGFPRLTNPFSNISLFADFFRRPFWYKTDAPWYFEVLYAWQYILTPVVLLFSLIGYRYLRKTKLANVLISSSLGFLAAAFLLRTLITFPNVSFHEQSNYPLRLLVASVAILIPLATYGIYKWCTKKIEFIQQKLRIQANTLYILGAIKIGILLMLSLYFSYPQYNSKVYFPGFNVTEYDKKVIEYIHSQNTEYNYVVLSSILTAVTALTEYPFAKYIDTSVGPQFYYSIPAGAPLYLFYEKMLYEGQERETIEKVFEFTKADKVYFVVPWYWKNSDKIVAGAKKTADSWQSIDDKMWIFEYTTHNTAPQAL